MITIGYDFQGWPVKAMTLREVFEHLGFSKSNDGSFTVNADNPLLDAYPQLLEDDGMGYGVLQEYITSASGDAYDAQIEGQNVKVFNLFREMPSELKEELEGKRRFFDEMDKAIDEMPIPDITTKEHVRELGELLRMTCLDYIEKNNLTDVRDVKFNILGINDEDYMKEWDVIIDGMIRVNQEISSEYPIGRCSNDSESDWHRKDFNGNE